MLMMTSKKYNREEDIIEKKIIIQSVNFLIMEQI